MILMLTLCIWLHSLLVDVQHKLEADVQCMGIYVRENIESACSHIRSASLLVCDYLGVITAITIWANSQRKNFDLQRRLFRHIIHCSSTGLLHWMLFWWGNVCCLPRKSMSHAGIVYRPGYQCKGNAQIAGATVRGRFSLTSLRVHLRLRDNISNSRALVEWWLA
jgi:hypothetical protein